MRRQGWAPWTFCECDEGRGRERDKGGHGPMLDAEDNAGLVAAEIVDECKVSSNVVSISSSGCSVWMQVALGSSKGSGM